MSLEDLYGKCSEKRMILSIEDKGSEKQMKLPLVFFTNSIPYELCTSNAFLAI